MKLYHIDRMADFKEGSKVEYKNNITIERDFMKNEIGKIMKNRYPEGLSHFGRRKFLDAYSEKNISTEIIFEYERLLNYPEKLSRFQSLFCFDLKGVFDFIELQELDFEFFKVYEVEYDYYEKHNMRLISGWGNYDAAIKAKYYWENLKDYDKKRKPIYEYLVKLPVVMKKEVKISDLRKQYNKLYKERKKNEKK